MPSQEIPAWVYTMVGVLIIGNLGTIGVVLKASHKLAWWASKVDSKIDANEKDINNAHKAIRDVKRELKEDLRELS